MAEISVLGLGNMGSAFASTLVRSDREVAAWNRNPERPTPSGVRRLHGLNETVLESRLVLVILLDHTACIDVFSQPDVVAALTGRTVINFTTSTPEEARVFGKIIREAGADYLTGVIPAYPGDIGKTDTGLIFSGEQRVWENERQIFQLLGPKSWWAGEDLGAAPALDLAMVGAFYHAAWGAFLEAMAYAESHGVSHEHSTRLGLAMTGLLASSLELSHEQISKDDYSTDQATVNVHLAALELITESMSGFAMHRNLSLASVEHDLKIAQQRGLGEKSLSVIYEHLRNPDLRGKTS